MYRPRIIVECAWCGGTIRKRQFYARNGCGTNDNPQRPARDLHPRCAAFARRAYGKSWAAILPRRSAELEAMIDALPVPSLSTRKP